MQTNTYEKLDSIKAVIDDQLTELNAVMRQMLYFMPKPPGKFRNAMDIGLAIVGISAVVTVVDTVLNWFTGG